MVLERKTEEKADEVSVRPVGKDIGERISLLRRERRLSLEALAAGTGLTASYLSKLERGRTSISVDNLRNVAHFLSVEMVYFFEREESSSAVVMRGGTGPPLALSSNSAFGESLVTTKHSTLQATLYQSPCGEGRAAGFSHPGEEFVHVIRGQLRYWVGSREFLLSEGDSLWHRSYEPHSWQCVSKNAALTLNVNTPPVW